MELNGTKNTPGRLVKRVAISLSVIASGFVIMLGLAALKKPPVEVKATERPIFVETVTAAAEDISIHITGYGEVRPLEVVSLAPEVSGRIVEIHPRLRRGEVISEGDMLFRIDPSDYQASLAEASATVAQLTTTLTRLETQKRTDEKRLDILNRNRELALKEYRRVDELYERDKIGTRSGVEATEQVANNAANQADMLAQTVALYPIRIEEAKASLAAAKARRDLAATRLSRTTVTAPFTGRITQAALEKGQYVTPGQGALTLANDAILEIHIPLDSRDVKNWLTFDTTASDLSGQWFNHLEPVSVTIRWTEDPDGHTWAGQLHRVVGFDTKTRTVTVAVRVTERDSDDTVHRRLPLVDGMFCKVEIPGRILRDAMRLPRYAVSYENTVYVSRGGRLKTVPVTVAHIQGDEALVTGGLTPGEEVIVTRLVEPLENALLEVTKKCTG